MQKPRPKVLVVEDQMFVRMVAVDAFEEAGFDVIEADSGARAIELLADQTFDALFTDIWMPGSPDGLDLAHQVRALSTHCAILIVSGHTRPPMAELPRDAHFVQKPYQPTEVVELVTRLLTPR